MGWCNGKPPSDIDEATEALEVVIGREAAAECLAILNEPIPREWNLPQYVVEFYEDTKDLSPDEKAEMWQEVQDIVKRFTKKQGRREES
jgi:hypothetical protein